MATTNVSVEKFEKILYGGPLKKDLRQEYKSFGDLLIDRLWKNKDSVLAIHESTEQSITGAEILSKGIRFAEALKDYGIKRGDRIGIFAENSLEHYFIYIGIIFSGAIIAPIVPSSQQSEYEQSLQITQPTILLCSINLLENALKIIENISSVQKVIITNGVDDRCESFEHFISGQTEINVDTYTLEPVDICNDIVLALPSSGTSGKIKAAKLCHSNLLAHYSVTQLGPSDFAFMSIVTYSLISGCLSLFLWIIFGRKAIVLPHYNEENFFKCVEKYKVRSLLMSPGYVRQLLNSSHFNKYDLSSLKYLLVGGNIVPEELIEQCLAKFSLDFIRTAYAMTESITAISQKFDRPRVPHSIGTLELETWGKIVDPDTGDMLGPNERGEIMIRSDRVMKGFINDDEATANAFDADGFLHTGDIGYYDEHQNWYFVQRIKDVIIHGCTHIYPSNIESIVMQHPCVKDVCVLGVPHEVYGDAIAAFIVKHDNGYDDVSEQDIIDFVAIHDSQNGIDGGVHFIANIPKSAMGKPLRRLLKESICCK